MNAPTILVVEDEQLVALDIERRLTPLGYSVVSASSGEEAIDHVRNSRPDLVLMDIKLDGGIDGIEAAQRIRAMADIPIVYLTSYADEGTLDRARSSQPYGYLLKPFDSRELKATIEMALERSRSDRRCLAQEELQHFLADASARMAESLDYETLVGLAAGFVVPRYADSCLVYLKPLEDSTSPLAMIYPARAGGEPSSGGGEGSVIGAALATAQPQILTAIADPAAELLGHDHLEILRAAGLAPHAVICVPLLARGRTLGAILWVSARADRHYGPAELEIAEDLGRRFSVAIDNALLYREARGASRLREEVLAVVSHDLRNPLGTILMRAHLIANGRAAPESSQAIVRAAERMNRLIGDLVDAASIDAGRLSVEYRAHPAAQLLAEAVDAQRPIADAKGVLVHDVAPPPIVGALCDRDRVLQVLANLIGNAVKFTPAGGAVTVRAEPDGARVRFSISDTGPGIEPDQMPHLFERFWRANAGREGAGLGLYIAKGIVEAHGGRIWAESESGRGTTLFFTLPAASEMTESVLASPP